MPMSFRTDLGHGRTKRECASQTPTVTVIEIDRRKF